jgi:hypothetical protein
MRSDFKSFTVCRTIKPSPQQGDEGDISDDMRANYVALDCEMVGIGHGGNQSALARCCLVDFDGNKLYDEFVRPKSRVIDYRTQWSGIRPSDLHPSIAITLEEVRQSPTALPLIV